MLYQPLLFDLASDLHINCWPDQPVDWHKVRRSELLVLPGDVADTFPAFAAEIERLSSAYKSIIYTPGNHELEHFGYNIRSFQDAVKAYKDEGKFQKVHFLLRDSFEHDGVAFIGAPLLWDFHMFAPEVDASRMMAAFDEWAIRARLAPDTGLADYIASEGTKDLEYLRDMVSAYQGRSDIISLVMVTHTPPLRKIVSIKDDLPDYYRACTGHSRSDEILKADTNRKIGLWCHGHDHMSFSKPVDGRHFARNPRGRTDTDHIMEYKPHLCSVPSAQTITRPQAKCPIGGIRPVYKP